MIDIRPILFVIGILLTTLAAFMFLPAMVDATLGHPDWRVFLSAAFFTLFIGVSLILMNRTGQARLNVRQTFLLTTLAWVVTSACAALPFTFADIELDYADAFFEAMSGLTTTGSTVMVGLDDAPPGILLWRALLQWQGGIGIIVMAIAVLPMLGIGGMQLFRTESSDKSDKALPRAAQIATAIGVIYLSLSMAAAVAYWAAGMTPFEAVCHAMTTIATGGYSTSDGSIGHFKSPTIEWIVTLFMAMSGIPFLAYFELVRGRGSSLWGDDQVRWYFAFIACIVLLLAIWLWWVDDGETTATFRHLVFNVVSIVTTTGFASTDYSVWGGVAATVILFATFAGGCSGSTTGGIKAFRVRMLYALAVVRIKRLLYPHGVFVAHFNRRPISDEVADAVMSFFFLYALVFAVVAVTLAGFGLDFMTSVSGAATVLANVGPGLGDVIGPAGNFAGLPDSAKWLLSAAMLLGRLELFTVLVLFTPRFWRG